MKKFKPWIILAFGVLLLNAADLLNKGISKETLQDCVVGDLAVVGAFTAIVGFVFLLIRSGENQ